MRTYITKHTIIALFLTCAACDPGSPEDQPPGDMPAEDQEDHPIDTPPDALDDSLDDPEILWELPSDEHPAECHPGGCCAYYPTQNTYWCRAMDPANCKAGTWMSCLPGQCYSGNENGFCVAGSLTDFQGKCCSGGVS